MIKRIIILFSIITSTLVYSDNAIALQYTIDVQPATTRVKYKFTLTNTDTRIGVSIPYNNNYQGQDSYVVVIDTGVQVDHPFLQGRVALEACFATSCPNRQSSMVGPGAAAPVHWHGTHVAGIIAGSNSSMHGVAPKANIIAVNVFDPDGASYDDSIIRALQWVSSIASSYNIAAVNMSLGSQMVFTSSCNSFIPEMTSIIAELKTKDIATVVSAGNGYSYGMSSPACITDTVSVAATYYFADEVTPFSNVSELTTLSAPGYVVSSSATGSTYRTASGTSMSAPTVAGSFAVYRSKFGRQSVNSVVSNFRSTAVNAIDKSTNINTKRIDLRSLFTTDQTTTTTTTTTSTTTTTTTTLPIITTTTIPTTTSTTSTSTTTTTIDEDDDYPEDTLNIPYIVSLKKHNSTHVYISFVYRHNSLPVNRYSLQCSYTNNTSVTKIIFNAQNDYNKFYIRLNNNRLSKCRIAAISMNTVGIYSKYLKVR